MFGQSRSQCEAERIETLWPVQRQNGEAWPERSSNTSFMLQDNQMASRSDIWCWRVKAIQ
jgi:hypothetical protein